MAVIPHPTTSATAPLGATMPCASEIAVALAQGETTPSRVAQEHLALIEELEERVRAWEYVDGAGARARARDLERTPGRGLLFGIPFGIKDNIDTRDMPTAYGSPIHAGRAPARDAACVACLRLEGANPLGKTVSAEFAHRVPGPTRNPWNPRHTPGGSSSGSAAAVASGMVPLALGSQTTGSVIRPAAYFGVVGYKPTYGEFNLSGTLANTPSFDTLGVMARCVDDVVMVRRALLDPSVPELVPAPLTSVRLAICRTPYWDRADPETRQLIEASAACLERAGARLVDFDGGDAFLGIEEANLVVSGYEFARTMAHERHTALEHLSADLRDGRMCDGLRTVHLDYVQALQRIEAARRELDAALLQVDLVLTPAAPGAAPAGLHATGSADFNMMWTTLHVPAVTLPVGTGSGGLPLGVQLVSRRHDDDRLLALAATAFAVLRE